MVKKSEIMAVLKSLGYGFVKIETPNGLRNYKNSISNVSVKGIHAVYRNPLDVTNVKDNHIEKVRQKIITELKILVSLLIVEAMGLMSLR